MIQGYPLRYAGLKLLYESGLPASASQAYGTTTYVSTPSKNHHDSLIFSIVCACCVYICVCVHARVQW